MGSSFGLSPDIADYVRAANRDEHPALVRCRVETAKLGDAARMQISPEQGAFLQMLVRLTQARDAIEVGTFTGYSATATALAMQALYGDDARLVACDVSDAYMGHAVMTFESAGVAEVIEPRVGPASDTLASMLEDGETGSFDLAFVDADKTGYADYFEKLMPLMRSGGIIAFDNVLWGGSVADPDKQDADTQALRDITQIVRRDARVDTAFTTIGDGLLLAMKR